MSLQSDIFDTVKGLVGNRMARVIFPQAPPVLTWPAILFQMVDSVPSIDICGAGDETTDDARFQLKLVATTAAGVDALRQQVIATMQTLEPEIARDFCGPDQYDEQRKTFYATVDYLFHGSS